MPAAITRPRDPAASRCLVLGAAGFLGGHIVEALTAQGLFVRAFDRVRPPEDAAAAVEWVEGDFGNRGDLLAAFDGCDTAIHLVSTTLPKTSNEDPVHDLESNLVTTVRFLDLARERGLRRVVFASSGGTVYGAPDTVPIPETHATRPICSYGIHKVAIERYLDLYHELHGLEYCVLRLANPFGERQRPDGSQGAVAVFLQRALARQPITIYGEGSDVRDYIYVGDVARAFHLAVIRRESAGVFNIGSGHGRTVLQLVEAIERTVGHPVERRHTESRPFDVSKNVLDISLAARALGWEPESSFAAGLDRTVRYLRAGGRTVRAASPAPSGPA